MTTTAMFPRKLVVAAAVVSLTIAVSLWTSRAQLLSFPGAAVAVEKEDVVTAPPRPAPPRYEYPDVLGGSNRNSNHPNNQSTRTETTKRNEECKTDPHQSIQVKSRFLTYSNTTSFMVNLEASLAAESSQYAVCQFVSKDYSKHFAHAMQQLYGCWSFWKLKENRSRVPILQLSPNIQQKLVGNAFLRGFLDLLTEQHSVKIVSGQELAEKFTTDSQSSYPTVQIDVKGGYIISDTAELISPVSSWKNQNSVPSSTGVTTIGILNRRKGFGRSILNTEALAKALLDEFGVKPTIEYFEQASFHDQVQFFSNHTIIISGHGAQLTGIAFSRPCTHLIEIFPNGYAIPEFFGSLATSSKVLYSYMYLSDQSIDQQEKDMSLGVRMGARAKNLCPSTSAIISHVKERMKEQQSCLNE